MYRAGPQSKAGFSNVREPPTRAQGINFMVVARPTPDIAPQFWAGDFMAALAPEKKRSFLRCDTYLAGARIHEAKLSSFDPMELNSCRGKTTGLPVDA